jgi:ATP-dependent exoDNAse (exonuclease V) beta subunit
LASITGITLPRQLGCRIPISIDTPLTGHIDVLQIRNGKIHILDYKPGAVKEKPTTQLMVYALALSRRTGLRLYNFVCAWFDEQHYYEFYPLHVVHKRPRAGKGLPPTHPH